MLPPISSDDNPQSAIALDSDKYEHYVLTPKPVLWATPTLSQPKQAESAKNPKGFTVLDAGNYSNADFTNFWNHVFFTKHSDTTLNLLGKVISYDFLATSEKQPTDSNQI